MRTLKKSLALVLALVMVLGLAVVGASADNAIDKFEDSDQIGDAYLEAVGVLTGLGIVDGMTDTEIAPQGTYQRDQAAKIIAYMVLGKEAADSLVASYAPFQDVPADYWAAGYIAFCKEQGIIDGVSDTSFDPYGTLTGFQWAKMLLAAVGFNANNELEGDSWSLNTARTGHEVGLFDGDIAGADHVALRREQAMLYAFNTLTNVRQVSYTGNGNNYVYDIFGYEWADGTGYTLGYDVFDLKFVEGQIVDNEGVGANKTYIENVNYEDAPDGAPWWWVDDVKVVGIKAETNYDMMYHAVRAWYTGSDSNGTNVYVYDLADVTTYECQNIPTVADVKKDLDSTSVEEQKLGNAIPYEVYVIDNTALNLDDDYAYVTLTADVGNLTYRNTAADTTTIEGEAVDNDDIMTDISDIEYGDEVIYFALTNKTSNGPDGEAWHVFAPTSTTGVISKISRSDDDVISVTLEDDTVLEMSNLFDSTKSETEAFVVGYNYTFVLDTHGDVMYFTMSGARDLWAFTGDYRATSDYNDYFSSQVIVAEFVKVGTTEVEEFSVVTPSGAPLVDHAYYNISALTNDDGDYVAYRVTERANVYAGTYVIENQTVKFPSGDEVVMGVDTVYFDPDTVQFIIASGSGNSLEFTTLEGVDALVDEYGISAASEITLQNVAAVTHKSLTGDLVADTFFCFDTGLTVQSGYVFVPYDVTNGDWSEVTGVPGTSYEVTFNNVAYIDGKPISVVRVVDSVWDAIGRDYLARGFYTYTRVNGTVTLTGYVYADDMAHFDTPTLVQTATGWEMNGYDVTTDVAILDLRKGNDYTEIASMNDLYYSEEFYNGKPTLTDPNLRVAYVLNSDDEVVCIYVVRNDWGRVVDVAIDTDTNLDELGWYIFGQSEFRDETGTEVNEVTFKLKNNNVTLNASASYNVTVTGADVKEVTVDEENNALVVTVNDIVLDSFEVGNNNGTVGRNGYVEVIAIPATITANTTAVDGLIAALNRTTANVGESVSVTMTFTSSYGNFNYDAYSIESTLDSGDGVGTAYGNNDVVWMNSDKTSGTYTVSFVVDGNATITVTSLTQYIAA